jgi:hypothetical protein
MQEIITKQTGENTMNNLLENRTYKVSGNWYAPKYFLKEFKSVEKVELYDTTSSAGDWWGYFIQKIGSKTYLILFSQENNHGSFVLSTGNKIASWDSRYQPEKEEIYEIIQEHVF